MNDSATIAGLIALAVSLVKLLELFAAWALKKIQPAKDGSNGHVSLVQLDPITSQALRDILERVHDVSEIVKVKDRDGTPMVYSSRTNNDNVQQIATCLRDVSKCQERIVERLDKMDDKLSAVENNSDNMLKAVSRK